MSSDTYARLEDWERDARGMTLQNAYTSPVMQLFNALDDDLKRLMMDRFKVIGVQSGLCKDATPEQRKRFMLWAEERWGHIVATLPAWPKPSLAAKFQQAKREGRYNDAPRTDAVGSIGGMKVKVEQPPGGHTFTSISGAVGNVAPTKVLFTDKRPSVALAVNCWCGKKMHLKAVTGEYRCECGATWTVRDILINARPPDTSVTFGADPEGDGPEPYEGTSVRKAAYRMRPQPTVYRAARPVSDTLPSDDVLGPDGLSKEIETDMPHGFVSMWGATGEREPGSERGEQPHWGPPHTDYADDERVDLEDL